MISGFIKIELWSFLRKHIEVRQTTIPGIRVLDLIYLALKHRPLEPPETLSHVVALYPEKETTSNHPAGRTLTFDWSGNSFIMAVCENFLIQSELFCPTLVFEHSI